MAFINIGNKVYIDSTEILFIIPFGGAYSKQIRQVAREQGKAYSACASQAARSVIILKNGNIVTSTNSPVTLAGRMNKGEYELLARMSIRYAQMERHDDAMVLPVMQPGAYKKDRDVIRPLDDYYDDDPPDQECPMEGQYNPFLEDSGDPEEIFEDEDVKDADDEDAGGENTGDE